MVNKESFTNHLCQRTKSVGKYRS